MDGDEDDDDINVGDIDDGNEDDDNIHVDDRMMMIMTMMTVTLTMTLMMSMLELSHLARRERRRTTGRMLVMPGLCLSWRTEGQ